MGLKITGAWALLFDEDFKLTDVFAKGRTMMRSGEILVKGVFET